MMKRARHCSITNAIALAGLCIAAGVAHAAEPPYPTRPVRLVVPFAPGGGVDATARIIAPKLSESMGQNWVVDNRTGAAGNIASEIVARANAALNKVLGDAELKERLARLGYAPRGSTPQEFHDFLRNQITVLTQRAREAGLEQQ